MMSLRALARSAPRALPRYSGAISIRHCAAPSLLRVPVASARLVPLSSTFSTSSVWRAPAGNEVDEELSAKLDNEIQFEAEVKENEPQPASVKDFLDSGLFEIEDIPGREDVVLRRTYGNEKITVTFSIADLANFEPDMYDDDPALADEDAGATGGSASQSTGAMPGAEEEGDEDLPGAGADAAVPCQLNIVVEKPGKGALSISATAQDGSVMVENMHYYADASLAHGATAELDRQAQGVYPGPPFGSLDEDLQVLMERYLEERGITQALAVFVPDYMDLKEQREYVAWLNNMKGFVDA